MKIIFNIYLIPAAIILFFAGQFNLYAIAYFSAFIHEAAHVLIARRFNLEVKEIEFLPVGFTARISGAWKLSVKKELIMVVAGPAVNLLICVFLILITKLFKISNSIFITNLIMVNSFLVCFNILPIMPLDGGRISMLILSRRIGIIKCAEFCLYVSKVLNAILFILAFMLLAFSGNVLIIIIICYIFGFLLWEDKCIIADSFLYILNKKSIIKEKQVVQVKLLAVTESTCLISLIKEIDRTRVISALVINYDDKIAGTIDEYKIIEYASNRGASVKIKELL